MIAYYGNRISQSMTKTPEGFLICHNVPIARTGAQDYYPHELGLNVDSQDMVSVNRREEVVFSPATIASFEGKPVTDDHPPVGIDTSNYGSYLKGVTSNVRHGRDDYADCLVADLIIHDAKLIAEIEAGKREVSCGYDGKYLPNEDGTYDQACIIGNHVAVVDNGRAGPRVAIKDEKPKLKGDNKLKDKIKKGVIAKLFSHFAKDADPEELQQAADALYGEQEPPTKEETKDEDPLQAIMSRLDAIEAKINTPASTTETDELESLEKELEKPAADTEEESVTISPEKIGDEEEKPEQGEEKPVTTDSAAMLRMIKAIKPIAAALPKQQRDAMGKAMRDAMAVKPTQAANYADLIKRKTVDAAPKEQDKSAFGEACRKRNPHYKGDK